MSKSSRIVTTSYRYTRPPRKQKPVALEVPAIVAKVRLAKAGKDHTLAGSDAKPGKLSKSPTAANLPNLVAAQQPKWLASIPSLFPDTPEERRRRGDAADALWRDMVRRVREK